MSSLTYFDHRGCRLAYKVQGAGPRVLWIQGSGLHGDGWLPQVGPLSREFSCLTFDNRGMGASQPLGGALTVAQMADDALALIDAAGWSDAHLVGHSLGGLIALQIALTAPGKVRSLALLCTFSRGSDATRLTPRMFWLGLRTYLGTRAMRRRAFLEMVFPAPTLRGRDRDAWAAELAPVFGHDLADHPPVVLKQLAAMKACDVTPRLQKLANIPSLIVGARHDVIARPEVVRRLAGALPQATLVEIPDAGHGVTLQQPVEVNELLRSHFLAAEAALKQRHHPAAGHEQ